MTGFICVRSALMHLSEPAESRLVRGARLWCVEQADILSCFFWKSLGSIMILWKAALRNRGSRQAWVQYQTPSSIGTPPFNKASGHVKISGAVDIPTGRHSTIPLSPIYARCFLAMLQLLLHLCQLQQPTVYTMHLLTLKN